MPDRFKNIKEVKKEYITLEFLYNQCKDRFKLEKISEGEINPSKVIKNKDIHRPGLALAGYFGLFTFNRIQVFGNTEIRYLNQLSAEERLKALERVFSFDVPCIIITSNNEIQPEILSVAKEKCVTIFRTPYPTNRFTYFITDFLDDQFSTQAVVHGSFVDVYGVGLLFTGNSGIGKSEVALDLVERGHRIVADDVIIASKKAETVIMGSGTELGKHFIEIRGLGIIDVRTIFGIRAIRYQKRIEVIVELEEWDRKKTYERTGLDNRKINLLGIELDYVNLPLFPGKNITVISEVIALDYLCKHYGYNAAHEFHKRLINKMEKNEREKSANEKGHNLGFDRTIEYFEHDFE